MTRRLVCTLLGILIGTSAAAGERVGGAELTALYGGRTQVGIDAGGAGVTYFGRDGRVYRAPEHGPASSGSWRVDADSGQLCLHWEGADAESCAYVERNADHTYSLIDAGSGTPLVEIKGFLDGDQTR
jgi:hypothetical protein